MNIRYRVELRQDERDQLTALLSGGKHSARKIKRSQILLAADVGVSDEAIAASVSVGAHTVYRTKRRFVEGNLELALAEEARPGAARKLTGREEALLVANRLFKTACRTGALDVGFVGGRDGEADRACGFVARDSAPSPGREGIEALAERDVVHPESGWRLCCSHGGCARSKR